MNTKNKHTGLENLPQTEPPDLVWERIEKKLEEEPKRRIFPIWLWTASGIAASLVILTGVWLTIPKEKTSLTADTPKAISPPPGYSESSRNQLPATEQEFTPEKQDFSLKFSVPEEKKGWEQQPVPQLHLESFAFSPQTGVDQKIASANASDQWNSGYQDDAKFDVASEELYKNQNIENTLKQLPGVSGNFEKGKLTRKRANIEFKDRGRKDEDKDGLSEYEEPVSNNESYASLIENEYLSPLAEPLSTFSIDVDGASYTNTRRMLNNRQKPPKDAIRIEEFINYFDYNYPNPKGEDPFSINLETASCPWNKDTRVVMIGLHGKEVEKTAMPPSNLVFLIDVSGSMQDENKLPLVKQSLKLLVDEMRAQDHIAIVTYAGAAGLALPSTACSEKEQIKKAIEHLEAGGSTAGGEGIVLAYKVAKENKKIGGNNRIILVTDGDFNVGPSSDQDMESLIKEKSRDGIFLTACGFGMGNYKDSKMEILADKGNGNYYYIDNFKESKKVFGTGLTGTLLTIAKDVKIQVEFNPKFVKAYRLIGYENRKMPPQDFHDDTKDAGELGAGHTVTALYEIIPVGSTINIPGFTELKYQSSSPKANLNDYGNELLTVKLRYKKPDEDKSKLLEKTLSQNTSSYQQASQNFKYACGVSVFGMILRDSKFKSDANYSLAKTLILGTELNISNGFRAELIQLIDKAALFK